ncbi:ATP-binding protein [Phenylobacterium montanum]|uniref:histidine kinase n=1 Tax=Phenylobacterium montanum TaxID=2823693 RepID=A0A975FYX2_9CAUL|nr:ATP-binding protein [Caulobacter sp. S6]QUD88018.1 PAS domain S-box protein [Caulobacter sp. S6]
MDDGRIDGASAPPEGVPPANGFLLPVGVALATFGLAAVSLLYTRALGHIAAVWPANAILLSALLSIRTSRWALVTASAWAGLAGALLVVSGFNYWPAPIMAACNAGEALLCAAGLRRVLGRDLDLIEARDLSVFVAMAGVAAPLASAVPAAAMLSWIKHGPFLRYAVEWFGSTGLGFLILTPALTALTPEALAPLASPDRRWRAIGLFALLGVSLGLVFLQSRNSLLFLLMPVLMAITFLLEQAGGALAMLVTAIVAVAASIVGRKTAGAAPAQLVSQLLQIQFFLAVAVVSVLAAAAVLGRQRRLTDTLRESLAETEAARALALEHQRWAAMAEEIASVGHWRFDLVTGATVWSDEIYRIYGLDPADGIPDREDTLKLYHPDDQPLVRSNFNRCWRDGVPFAAEVRVVRPDGAVRNVLSRGAAERDAATGRVRAIFGAFMDITEAKAVERVLRESEERYRMLTDRATDIILRYDTSGLIEFASPAVRLLGYEPEQVVGRRMGEFVHPDDARVAAEGRKAAADGVSGAEGDWPDVRVRCADGGWIWVQGSPSAIRSEQGAVIGVVTVLRDVTARRAMEDELRRKKAEAEAADIAKSEFMANMSHEIRTPLTAIIGFSALLERFDALPEQARRHVQRIVAGGQALLDVVNHILDFSKLEAAQVELDPQPFDPEALLDEAMALVAGQAAFKGLELVRAPAAPLPPRVLADPARVKQILLNLLTNAVKFTDQGSVTVSAHYHRPAGRLEFVVSDTGCGIPEDKRHRLFARFSQVDSSLSRRHGGTGLGLAICKSLVDLMGGEIEVESREGVGSTFRFAVPAPLSIRGEAEREGRAANEAPAAPVCQILIVDDRPENRELVRNMLEALGHVVVEAGGGAQALALASSRPYDLILMDLQMPGMDGFAAARAIRSRAPANRDTPIVALSANVLAEHVALCFEAGMNDHIGKPVRIEDLAAKIAEWMAPDDEPSVAAG